MCRIQNFLCVAFLSISAVRFSLFLILIMVMIFLKDNINFTSGRAEKKVFNMAQMLANTNVTRKQTVHNLNKNTIMNQLRHIQKSYEGARPSAAQ